jgi:hypothetical protein
MRQAGLVIEDTAHGDTSYAGRHLWARSTEGRFQIASALGRPLLKPQEGAESKIHDAEVVWYKSQCDPWAGILTPPGRKDLKALSVDPIKLSDLAPGLEEATPVGVGDLSLGEVNSL